MHSLATELGMTVRQLSGDLTYQEFLDWIAYFNQSQETEDRKPPEELPALSPDDFKGLL